MGSRQKLSVKEGYSKIAECCDCAYIQGNWNEWLRPGLFDKEIELARSKGLKVYVALDLLGYKPKPRANIDLPKGSGFKSDFTDARVQSTYLRILVRRIAEDDHPDYFVVLVEANLHKKFNPASFAAYKGLYPTVVNEVHRLSPSTKVAASVVYGDLTAPKGFDDQDRKQYFVQSVQDFDSISDLLAVSTYPKYYLDPAENTDLVSC